MTVDDLVGNFLESREQGISGARKIARPDTIRSYIEDMQHLLTFMRERGITEFEAVKRVDWANFRAWIHKRATWSAATKNKVWRSMRALSYFVQKDPLCQELELVPFRQHLPVIPKATPRKGIPEPKDLKQWLAGISTHTMQGKRNYAMIMLMLDTGIRLGELIGITMKYVKLDQKHIIVDGKTGPRVVYVTSNTARILLEWIKWRNNLTTCDRLFVQRGGEPMGVDQVEKVFARLSKRTGVKIHPHLLRHYFCTQYLKSGGSLEKLAEITGHTSLDQLKDYTHLSGDPSIQRELEEVSPTNNLKHKPSLQRMKEKYATAR